MPVSLVVNGVPSNPVQFTYTSGGTGGTFAISPSSGPPGTNVSISSSGNPGWVNGQTYAQFGGVAATTSCPSPNFCSAVAPGQPYGASTVTLTLVTYGAQSAVGQFTYTAGSYSALTISARAPP